METDNNVDILIVDDTPSKMIALQVALKGMQINIFKAYSSIDAMKQLLNNNFAVILLDVCLPYIDGFELSEIIRQRKKSENTPIIFISSVYLTQQDITKAYKLGAVDYITAPVIPEVLRGKVSVFVNLFRISSRLQLKTLALEDSLLKLRRVEEMYRKVVELMPSSIIIHNNNSIIFSNSSTVKLLDYDSSEKLQGKPLSSVLEVDANKKGQGLEAIWQIKHPKRRDGKLVTVECLEIAFDYDSSLYMLVMRDLTEKIQSQSLKKDYEEKSRLLNESIKMDRLRDEFFANISHEFKTPINIIYTSVQLLTLYLKNDVSSSFKDMAEKYYNIMTQNSYRLIRLVDNLIDLTKIETGFYNLQIANNNIISVVEEIVLSVAAYIKNKGGSINFDTDVEELDVACDANKIERIILNLLSNAVKFLKPGGAIFVNICTTKECVTISIKDTGIGIPEDKLKIIFERFKQVDKSLSRNREGSGLGLAIVKALVELHDGTICVNSEVDKGSEFIIKIPIRTLKQGVFNENNYKDIPFTDNKIDKISIEFSDVYGLYQNN